MTKESLHLAIGEVDFGYTQLVACDLGVGEETASKSFPMDGAFISASSKAPLGISSKNVAKPLKEGHGSAS